MTAQKENTESLKEEIIRFKRKITLFIGVIVFLVLYGIFIFKFVEGYPFKKAASMTFETFVFIIHAKEGIARLLELSLAIFGVIIIWWTLWSIFDLLIEGNLREYLKTRKFLNKLNKMKNHYIIAGGGRVGEEIANALKNSKQYIIIEKDDVKVNKLKKKGFSVIQGDVADSDTSDLISAGIKNARVLILAMPETEKNLLVTMTAKELAPDIEVYARADNPAFISKLKKAGAKAVIVPEVAAAEKILKELSFR